MEDVVLKDRSGNNITHSGVSSVKLINSKGTLMEFFTGEKVEKIVDPDFSEGNIEVTPEDGEFLAKVTVNKPPNLIAENVAEGVDIGGIVGTHSGGGGVDLEGDFLKYVIYQIDDENKEIILYKILYDNLYADTGSYDVSIPSKFGAYSVVIKSEGA